MRVLVTGGAGFVGGNVAIALSREHEVVALDNLSRRGSEISLPRLAAAGVEFLHGDIRVFDDVLAAGAIDALVECSAEPSALAGTTGDTSYLVHTNLVGAYNCLEVARRTDAALIFLSTSRVYPYGALDALPFEETETRFELTGEHARGVAEDFPLQGPRTLYGATKLAAELLITEYAAAFGVRAVVDRCGVIAGPWQMGKVDQGVFTFWMLRHHFGLPLSYIGYGGTGKQVRDLLHIEDLVELVGEQLDDPGRWAGATVNVGGGREVSLSLRETTALCERITGRTLDIGAADHERPGDVRVYLSDTTRLQGMTSWRPTRDATMILRDIHRWVTDNEAAVVAALRLG